MLHNINTRNKLSYPLILIALTFSFSLFAQDNTSEQLKPGDENLQSAAKDDQTSKNYVLNLEKLVDRFESAYQSAKTEPMGTKQEYLTKMNSIFEEFTNLKYNSSGNAMVMDLRRLVGAWMDKRMNYVDKLIMQLVYKNDYSHLMNTADMDYVEQVYKTNAPRSLLNEGNADYNTMMTQMSKVKSFYSI